jgi:hypothetical protein
LANGVCELALQIKDCVVDIDELDRLCRGKKWASKAAERIVHEGRHYRVSLLGSARRTAKLHEDILSQADYMFLFHHSHNSPWDIQTLRYRVGPMADELPKLQRHHFMVWKDDFGN